MSEGKTGKRAVIEPLAVIAFSVVLGLSGLGDRFGAGTLINGLDVSYMSVRQAGDALAKAADQYVLELDFRDGTFKAASDQLGLAVNPQVNLRKLMWQQVKSQGQLKDFYIHDLYIFDPDMFEKALSACGPLKPDHMKAPENASLAYDKDQDAFVLHAGEPGTTLSPEPLIKRAQKAAIHLQSPLDVEGMGFYKEAVLTPDGPLSQQVIEAADALTKAKVSYLFHDGEEEVIDRRFLAPLVTMGEDLKPKIDQKQLKKQISKMVGRHETTEATIYFETTAGDKIPFDYPADDDAVDKKAFQKDIMACIDKQASGERIVPYDGEAAENDHNFGGNYIEVDLDNQVLYLYKEGKLVMETEIVSGSTRKRSRMTPTGVYRVYSMLRNVTLKGDDYESKVSYWMPFKGGYGLHDATWRSSFGGTIYTYNGSHGCVNLPLDKARELYETIDVGFRVVVYDDSMKGEDNED